MINYIEKGFGLHRAIAAAGHWLIEADGIWQSSDDVAVQAIIDAYDLAACQDEVCAAIAAHAKALRDHAVADVSAGELASWPLKCAELAAFQASGDPAAAPVLSREAARRGIPLADMISKVAVNADKFGMLEAHIAGIDGRHRDAVRQLGSFADVLAYDWSSGWSEP